MTQTMIDFDHTLRVIKSCKNSKQNNIAYRIALNFYSKHKDSTLFDILINECDDNLINILRSNT